MQAFQNALIRLLKRRPFFAHLLLQCRRQVDPEGAPLGVSLRAGGPLLTVVPQSFAALDHQAQGALLEHCVRHLLHLHPLRRKGRHPLVWDAACDLAINTGLHALGDDRLLPSRFGFAEELAAEEYYQLLCVHFSVGHHRGQGLGRADAAEYGQVGAGGETFQVEELTRRLPDNHQVWVEAESTPLRLGQETLRQLVRDAARKADGEIPGDLQALVAGLLTPPAIPWRQVLRQFVATAGRVGRKTTWGREHRRFRHATPGVRKRQRLNLLIGVDVSDSTNSRPLREAFARELVQIARGRESRLTVLYAGSRIQKIASFNSSEAVTEVYAEGGFTDLRPVFDYARQMPRPPAAVIYLTDGFGEAPERMDFPTLWALTADGEKPADWGVELRLNDKGAEAHGTKGY